MLGRWCTEVNKVKFPKELKFLQPKGWDDMNTRERMRNPTIRSLYKLLQIFTTERYRSRSWWIYELGMTEKEWREWWDKDGKREAKELGLK